MLQNNMVGILHYRLTVDEKLHDSSSGKAPLVYLHGHKNIVPGLEAALSGKAPGDTFSVTVSAAEGYGERTGPGPQQIARKELPPGTYREGTRFTVPGPDGERVMLWVVREKGRFVWIDTEHPLAGKTLDFEIEVVDVRPATPDELSHGHAHGVDGHAHHS